MKRWLWSWQTPLPCDKTSAAVVWTVVVPFTYRTAARIRPARE
ncbi:MAG: hypothetical protein MPW13_12655 [Candidatus Manganitrophus sp.]|nr:hypothetical protein [Candidatus Manganitrophus sp.]